ISSAFIRSTIEVRHSSFSPLAATALSRIGATSTLCGGAAGDPPVPPGLEAGPPAVVVPGAAASALLPKIAPMIFPKMLIVSLPVNLKTVERPAWHFVQFGQHRIGSRKTS